MRLRFIYDHGTTSSLDVVMGAKSLGDAMTELDDFNRVAASNADVLLQVRSAQHHMAYLQRTLASREQTLAATTSAAAQTVSDLTAAEVRARRLPRHAREPASPTTRSGSPRSMRRPRQPSRRPRPWRHLHAGRADDRRLVGGLPTDAGHRGASTASSSRSAPPPTPSRVTPRAASRSAGASPRSIPR